MCTTATHWLFVRTLLDVFTAHVCQGMKEMVQLGDVSLFRYNNQALPLVLYGNAPIGLRTRGFCELKATDKELH